MSRGKRSSGTTESTLTGNTRKVETTVAGVRGTTKVGLHTTIGNISVKGFINGKPTMFTVDMGTTLFIVHPDIFSQCHPQFSSYTIQTMTGSPSKC